MFIICEKRAKRGKESGEGRRVCLGKLQGSACWAKVWRTVAEIYVGAAQASNGQKVQEEVQIMSSFGSILIAPLYLTRQTDLASISNSQVELLLWGHGLLLCGMAIKCGKVQLPHRTMGRQDKTPPVMQ